MKSSNPIKDLSEIVLPYQLTAPVTIEGSINTSSFFFPANKTVDLTYEQYEMLRHSSYEKYLN